MVLADIPLDGRVLEEDLRGTTFSYPVKRNCILATRGRCRVIIWGFADASWTSASWTPGFNPDHLMPTWLIEDWNIVEWLYLNTPDHYAMFEPRKEGGRWSTGRIDLHFSREVDRLAFHLAFGDSLNEA